MRLSPWAPVAVLFFSVPTLSQNVAKVKYVAAPAFVLRPGSLTQIKPGDALNVNDVLVTGAQGRARIVLLDASEVTLAPGTEIRVVTHDSEKQQTLIEMLHGRIRTKVTPVTKQGGFFKVATPTAITYALGTIETIEATPVLTRNQDQLEALATKFADLQKLQPNVNPSPATISPSPTSSPQPSDWYVDVIVRDVVGELSANITPPLLNGNYNGFNINGPWIANGFAITRPSFLTEPPNLGFPPAYSGPYSSFDSDGNDIWDTWRILSRGPIPDVVLNEYGRSASNNLVYPTLSSGLAPFFPGPTQFNAGSNLRQFPANAFDWMIRSVLQSGNDTISSRYIFNRGNNFNLDGNGTGRFSINVPALSQGTLLNWTNNFTSNLPTWSQNLPDSSFCAVQICRTNLLFPFITNQTGFDTGIAIGTNAATQGASPTPDSVGNSFTPSATQTQSFTLPAPEGSLSITINPVNNHPASGDPQVVPGSYYTFTRTFTDPSGTITSTVTRTGTLPTFPGVTGTQDALKGVLYIGLSLPNPNPSTVVLPQFNSATQTFNALHPFTTPNAFNLSTLPYLQQVPLPGGLHLIPNVNALNSAEIYDETYNTFTPITHMLDTPPTASQLAARNVGSLPASGRPGLNFNKRLSNRRMLSGNFTYNDWHFGNGGVFLSTTPTAGGTSFPSSCGDTDLPTLGSGASIGSGYCSTANSNLTYMPTSPDSHTGRLRLNWIDLKRDKWEFLGSPNSTQGAATWNPRLPLDVRQPGAMNTLNLDHSWNYGIGRSQLGAFQDQTFSRIGLDFGSFSRGMYGNSFSVSDWNTSNRLTLNYGVRWSYVGPPANSLIGISTGASTEYGRFGQGKTVLRAGYARYSSKFRNLFGDDATVIRGGYSLAYDPAFYNILLNISANSPSAFQPFNLSGQHGLIGALSSRSIPATRVATNTGAPPASGVNPFPTFPTLLDFKPGTANPDNKALSGLGITTKFTIWDGRGAAATRRGATYLNSGESVDIAADGTTGLPRMVLNASDFSGGNHVVNVSSKSAEFNETIKSLAQFEDCEPSIYINGVLVYGSGQIESEITGTGGSTPLAKIHIINYGSCVVMYIITNSAVLVPSHIIGKAGGLLAGLALGAATGGSVIAIPSLKELQDAIAAGRLIIVFAKPRPKEPSKGGGRETAEEEPEPNEVTVPIRSFCLDLHKLAPHPKSAYKFADEGKQRELGANGEIVNRVYRDVQSGAVKLPPGTSLDIGTQWTIWAIRQNLDAKKFVEEYLHIVEKNLEAQHKKLDKEAKANMEERAAQLFSFAQHFFSGAPKS